MTLDELERRWNVTGCSCGECKPTEAALTIHSLIRELRETRALVERAFREGADLGPELEWTESERRKWLQSDAKRALDALRGEG